MKKILVYGLTKNMGGLEVFIARTLLNMDMEGIQVHALVHEKTIFYKDLLEKGVIFHFVNRRGKRPLRNIKEVKKVFEENEFYSIWFNACTLTYITPLVIALNHGVKIRAIHAHSTDITRGNLMRFMHNLNKTRIDKYVNRYLGCTAEAAEFLAPDHVAKAKDYTVIKNAIELDKYLFSESIRAEVRQEFDINEDALVLGNVGHLIDLKNHEFLIEVFAEVQKTLNNSYLVIVGSGELEDSLKQLAFSKGLDDKIIFTGKRQDVNMIMNALDAFVMPSKFEGLPLVAVEAQASGLKTFLSTKISTEARLTDLVSFLDLEAGSSEWANEIMEDSTSYNRISRTETLKEKGFSVKENASIVKSILIGEDN